MIICHSVRNGSPESVKEPALIPRTKLSVGRDIKNKIVFHCIYFVLNVRIE